MASIYVITNNINGHQYVGKTTETILKRFSRHKSDARLKGKDFQCPLHQALIKYGENNFSIELLEECPSFILSKREQY